MAFSRSPQVQSHNVTRIPALGSPFEVANNSSREPQTLNYVDCFPIKEEQFGENPKYSVACREAFKSISTYDMSTINTGSVPNSGGSPPGTLSGYTVVTGGANTNNLLSQLILVSEDPSSVTLSCAVVLQNTNVGAAYQNVAVFLSIAVSGTTGVTVTVTPKYLYFAAPSIYIGSGASGTFTVNPGSGNITSIDPYYLLWPTVTTVQPQLVAPNTFKSQASPTYTVTVSGAPHTDIRRGMVYLDNYLMMVGTQALLGQSPYNAIYASAYSGDPYGPWDSTSFILDQIFPNEIEWIDKHHNYLTVFGAQSIEFFYDAGNGLGSPLARQPLYAKNIGILPFGPGKTVAKDKDIIYFIGKNENNMLDVFALVNFMVKPVGSHYIREVLNFYAGGSVNNILGIESFILDTHTMIAITFSGSTNAIVFFPEEEVWWTMTTTDLINGGSLRTNHIAATQTLGSNTTQRPYYAIVSNGLSTISICTTDVEGAVPTTASYFSEIIDLETSYWKHLARVYAVGDYGNRTLTLSYSNDPTYTTFVVTTTKSPLGDGYQNAVWWDNVTRFRRGSLKIDMSGIGPCHHKAFDIMYNMGTA